MSREKTPFTTHRCDDMPHGFSLRKYEDTGREHPWPEPGGWVLGKQAWDSERDYDYLDDVTPWAHQHVRFCPWCGADLEGEMRELGIEVDA